MIGTETWLSPSILNNEIIPNEWNYTIYRKDRSDNYGGVLIAISKNILSYEMTSLQTDCELLWVQITVNRGIKLLIGAYYRPHTDDQYSVQELNVSLQKLQEKITDAKIWLIGDFNVPNIDWNTMTLFRNKPHIAAESLLIDTVQEFGLEQIVNQPTRSQNILDLFLLNRPNQNYIIQILPGLGDHDIVCVDIQVQPDATKQTPREIYVFI